MGKNPWYNYDPAKITTNIYKVSGITVSARIVTPTPAELVFKACELLVIVIQRETKVFYGPPPTSLDPLFRNIH